MFGPRTPTWSNIKFWRMAGVIYLTFFAFTAVGNAEIPIHGKVTADGQVVVGAKVSLHRLPRTFEHGVLRAEGRNLPDAVAEAPTGPRGLFEITAPDIGMWTVRVEAPAYAPAEFRIQPLLQETQLPTVDLEPAADLTVIVRQAEDKPARARVLIYRMGAKLFSAARTPDYRDDTWNLPLTVGRTDDRGQLTVPVRAKGTYFVRVTASGLVPAEKEIKTAQRVKFNLAAGRNRTIRAVTANGRGAAGAVVYEEQYQLPLGRTDDEGRINLVQGEKPIRLLIKGAEGHSGDGLVALPENSQASGEAGDKEVHKIVTLEPPQRVTGRVIDADSRAAVAGALVWIAGQSGNFTLSDATGAYGLQSSGELAGVWATASRYTTAFETLNGKRAASRSTTLALLPAAIVGGQVVDSGGEPVAGVEVTASIKWDRSSAPLSRLQSIRMRVNGKMTRSTRQGGFQISGLPAGAEYQLHFQQDGFADHTLVVETLEPFERRTELHVVLKRGRLGFGQVVDQAGEPVSGAAVQLTPRAKDSSSGMMRRFISSFGNGGVNQTADALTNAEGRYEIHDLAVGKYDLEVDSSEFSRASVPGLEMPENVAEVDFGTVILEPGVPIFGRVTSADGRPLPRAEIRIGKDGGMPAAFLSFRLAGNPIRAHTNAKGEFQAAGLREGEKVHILIKHTGYVDATVAGVVAPTTEPLAVVMKPASKVRGRVVDEEGRPVKGAMVAIEMEAVRGLGSRTQSLGDGTFEAEDVAPGRVSISAQASGYQTYRISGLEVAEGVDLNDIELTVAEGSTVEGTVFAADGLPVIGAKVRAKDLGSSKRFAVGTKMTDGDGNYWLEGLPNEPCTVIAEFENQRVAREIEIEKGVNKLDLVFEGGVDVTGVVLGPQGAALGDVLVHLISGGGFSTSGKPQATSQADGTFAMAGVQPGQYTLWAAKKGYATTQVPEPIVVGKQPVSGLEVRLTAGATLVGNVTGLSVDDLARLTITASTNRDYRGGEVNFEGRYEVSNLAPGEWRVNAQMGRSGRSTSGKVTVTDDDFEVSLDLEFGIGYTLTGTVLVGNRPLAGAWVFASGKAVAGNSRATTDQDGRFRIEGLEKGTYHLNITSFTLSGLRHKEEVEIVGDDDILIELVTSRISGWVRDAFDHTPLAEARLSVQAVDGAEERNFSSFGLGNTTDSRGYFTLQEVPEGSWKVVAKHAGYGPVEQMIEVDGSSPAELEFEMTPTEGLFFEVAFATGGSPPRVSAAVLKQAGGGTADILLTNELETGENGRVRMTEVPRGSFELLLTAPGTATVALPVVSPNQLGRVTLPLGATMKITVPELVEESTSARVEVVSSNGTPYRRLQYGHIQTQLGLRSGTITVSGLEPGSWNVTVTTDDGRTWSRQVQVTARQIAQVVLE